MSTPPTRPLLRERYDARQRDVIDACARVFAERGYHATSIPDLMAATGLTRGGLYHYIESKEGALLRVVGELMDPLIERARALLAADPGASAEDRLRALTTEWMRHVEAHRHHIVVFQQERLVLARDPQWAEVRRARAEFEALLRDVLRDGVAAGEFVIADERLTGLAFLAMVNYVPQWFDPAGRLSADEIAGGFCDLLLNGIRRRDAAR